MALATDGIGRDQSQNRRSRAAVETVPRALDDRGGSRPMHPTMTTFLGYLRDEKGASTHTVRSYGDDLSLFWQYLDSALGESADPLTADARRLRAYSAWL